jgi:RNA polymerase sigma factor (sigma-70 family)
VNQAIQALLRYLRGTAGPAGADADLLERFARHGDGAAFAALVARHGPMVLGVCRRLLRDAHDAEDAFQATFLVLARKAGTLGRGDPVGAWLHGVACRTAAHARADRARRRAHERRATAMPAAEPTPAVVWEDLRPVLDEEVRRLPDKYRVPVVLCYLGGKTYDEAAREIGCPKGTVATRLAKARELLRERLSRRGLALTAVVLAAVVADNARAAVPAGLLKSTVEATTLSAASAGVTALAEGVLKAMSVARLKAVTTLVVTAGLLAGGVGALAYRGAGEGGPGRAGGAAASDPAGGRPPAKEDPKEKPPPADPGWIRVVGEKKTLLFRPDGTGRTETVAVPSARQPSPDGKSVLYATLSGNDAAIYVADADGTNARKVSADKVVETFPCWSPDGRRIAFLTPRGEHTQVHVMDRDGGNVRQVTDAPLGAGLPRFAPDGRLSYLAWGRREGKRRPADLVIGEGKAATALVKDAVITDYAWSPDGKVVAYGMPGTLVFHEVGSGKAQEVVFRDIDRRLDGHAALLICWSPDGRAVACSIVFWGGRQQGGPKMLGDDELFVIPRTGKASWFEPGEKALRIEWIKGK